MHVKCLPMSLKLSFCLVNIHLSMVLGKIEGIEEKEVAEDEMAS